jgi:hypothetical protein
MEQCDLLHSDYYIGVIGIALLHSDYHIGVIGIALLHSDYHIGVIGIVCSKSNTTGATNGTGTAYPSGAHEFSPICIIGGLCGSTFSFLCSVLYMKCC